jgi:hypothetical protein
MLNLVEKTLESLLSIEEALLQEKIELSKERLHKTRELGKLQRIPKLLMKIKKDIYLRRQEKSSKKTKSLHQRHGHK